MNDFYKEYAARKRKEAARSVRHNRWGRDTWEAMPIAKRIVAIFLLIGLLAVGGCGVAVMTGAFDSAPTARECQAERDEREIEGWPQGMVQGAFENCRREWWEAEGIEPAP